MHLQTILKVKSGSTLYNLRTSDSDEDIRGCVLADEIPYLIGLKHFEQMETKNPDTVLWNLPKFLKLAFGGNTQILECLAAPEEFVVECNPFGKFMRDNISKLLGKHICSVLRGYAYSEYKRTMGETTGRLGDARKQSLKKYEYSIKNASHCIRLLMVGIELFSTGKYMTTFEEGLNRKLLMDIKSGIMSKDAFENLYTGLLDRFENFLLTSSLPEQADKEFFINEASQYIEHLICQGIIV